MNRIQLSTKLAQLGGIRGCPLGRLVHPREARPGLYILVSELRSDAQGGALCHKLP
jgi:hypothetical protein